MRIDIATRTQNTHRDGESDPNSKSILIFEYIHHCKAQLYANLRIELLQELQELLSLMEVTTPWEEDARFFPGRRLRLP